MKKKISIIVSVILIIILLLLIIMLLSTFQFGGEEEKIELLGDVLRLEVGEIEMMPYKISNENNQELVFQSENPLIAKIDSQGYVYGLELGETFVTVSFQGQEDYAKKVKVIVVKEKEDGGGPEKYIGGDEEGKVDTPNDDGKQIQKQKEEKKTTAPPKTTHKPICSLKVSIDGKVTATTNNATKYSFDKNLTNNEKEKNVKNISNKETKDYEGWKYYKVYYYVEGEDNLKGSCSIVIIEKCNNGNCTYESFN